MAKKNKKKLGSDRAGIPERCCTLDIHGRRRDQFVSMCKALGNPIRFEILKFLLTHPGCITGNIVDHLPIAQSTTSQHLTVLRDAGWIEGTVDGPATLYCLNADNVRWFKSIVGEIL